MAAPSASRTLSPYRRAPSPMTTGIENTGEVPGLASVASTKIAPASMIARPGARCSAPRNSAPGSSTAAQRACASGPMSSGWIIDRWSTLRAPAASATGTERRQDSCSTWVRSASPDAAASSPISSRCSRPNAIDSTKMSSAVTLPAATTSGIISCTTAIHESAVWPSGTAWASSAVDVVVWGTWISSSRASTSARISPSRESP